MINQPNLPQSPYLLYTRVYVNHLVMGSLVNPSSHETCVTVSINHRNRYIAMIGNHVH